MSNFKDFSQQGVSGDLQFGKGGGRVIFKDGLFQFVASPTGTDLSRVKAAAPSEPDDVVTLDAMTTAVNHVYSKLDIVSTNLSVQASAMQASVANLRGEISSTRHDTLVSADGTHQIVAQTDGIHLSSPVVIGDSAEDGLIQPEGGHSLTIAGGDADAAGSVVIRGGHGANPGHVEVHDLVDPVHDQDAVTLSVLNSAIGKLSVGVQTNSIYSFHSPFNETSGDVTIGKISSGIVLRIKVRIDGAYAAGSSMIVRTSAKTLVTSDVIDLEQPGLYVIELLQETPADTIILSTTTSGGTGAGMVSIEYISA